MQVYLAGPEVFLPDAAALGERKKDVCRRYGLVGLFPLDSELTAQAGIALSRRIFRGNIGLMDQADAIVANLTPFRGPSADVGTVFEVGYMFGGRKPCLGYSNLPGAYVDKVVPSRSASRKIVRGRPVDGEGLFVEDFGLADNLMVVEALEDRGHPLLLPDHPPRDIWRDLTLFEDCVRRLAEAGAKRVPRRGAN
jgi:nucleoside 2-deoxyribosyltransferase